MMWVHIWKSTLVEMMLSLLQLAKMQQMNLKMPGIAKAPESY
ncbi:hypothetical protein OIU78_006761 [Salix suchowensis]|nr:hypothetical protein OIU78_006761 [Salix suchowensis]